MKRTVYVIISRRAVIIEKGWFDFNARSYRPKDMIPLWKKRKNGIGDVYFDIEMVKHRRDLSNVRDVAEAERQLEELRSHRKKCKKHKKRAEGQE
ncbi:MAG: hypothetical protein LBH00_07745 [Planctomycetaceae bacterium]|jgi:hypothetical protein|nr:hypothetical protein [Planctomycetaceae bacterium]